MEQSGHHPGGDPHELHASRHWRIHFLDHLAETSNIAAAAAHAGVTIARACRTRRDEPEFARLWLSALAKGYLHLEMEILRRLREGDFKASDTERYDFVNAIRLLAAHKDNVAGIQGRIREVSAAEVRASIDRKIEDIRPAAHCPYAPRYAANLVTESFEWFLAAPPEIQAKLVKALDRGERNKYPFVWESRARMEQLPPPGDWWIWMVMAGRGFGKTRAGAEWVRMIADGNPGAPIALVSTSLAEARAVMVEGGSGLLSVFPPDERPVLELS